ncbi:MAG: hypothetical protein R6V74_04530 [Lutibacter sp.]
MKNSAKLILIFLLLPLAIFATEKKGKYTKNKTISKEFKVSKDATLNVSNKYGNIDIVTWNGNNIEVVVKITTSGDDEDKVKKRLEEINVEFDANSTYVSAKTMIEKSSASWSWWGNKNNVNMEINYQIKMPVTNNVNLSNDYGGINLNKLEGKATINCDYGKLNIGELLNASNSINIDYTNNSTISYMKNGTVNADYSTLRIDKAGNIELNADYSHIAFGAVNRLNYSCDYGSLKIGNAENMNGTSDYMNLTVEKLLESGTFNLDYGSLKVQELGQRLRKLNIQSSYTHVKLGLHPSVSFDITATLSYSGFKHGNRFTFNKEIEKPTSKYYEGYYNSPNSGNQISIKSSYGSISFNNN